MNYIIGNSRRFRARLAEKAGDWSKALDLYRDLSHDQGDLTPADYYRIGHAAMQLELFVEASEAFERLVELSPTAQHWYRLGVALQKQESWQAALQALETAVDLDFGNGGWHYRIALCQENLGNIAEAISAAQFAVSLSPKVELHHNKLIHLVKKTNQLWMLAESYERAIQYFPEKQSWRTQLSKVLVSMERHEDVVKALQSQESDNESTARDNFHHGRALENLGRHLEAQQQYSLAIESDDRLKSKDLGIGVFYQSEADYSAALKWYERQLKKNPGIPELHYRIGLCHERQYAWEEAQASYEIAVMADSSKSGWHYRLGLMRERLCQFESAASAYQQALLTSSVPNSYWSYRLGVSLHRAGYHRAACEAFGLQTSATGSSSNENPDGSSVDAGSAILTRSYGSLAVAKPPGQTPASHREVLQRIFTLQSAELSFKAGLSLLSSDEAGMAVLALEDACLRDNEHTERYYTKLAQAYFQLNNDERAAEVFSRSRGIGRPFGIDIAPYTKSLESKRNLYYAEYCDTLPIQQEWILYESGAGQFVGCNPLAIFRQLIVDDEYRDYKHFWAVTDFDVIPDELRGLPNVVFVKRNSIGYIRILATAKYLINNNTFAPYFSRRKDQKYLNTWHGIPLKTLGRDIKSGALDHKNAARNLLHATHLIAPNKHTLDVLTVRNDIGGIFSGKAAILGYPRVDSTLKLNSDSQRELRSELGVVEGQRIVLYAPTWRGDMHSQQLDLDKIRADLLGLEGLGYHVLFKGHTMIEKFLQDGHGLNNLVPAHIDTNDLLSVVDVLITDYSSLLFDFMPTGRQIILYVYDEAEYRENRGLYFDLQRLPVEVCREISDVRKILGSHFPELDSRRENAKNQFWPCEDGHATRRAIEFFFNDCDDYVVKTESGKKQVLMFQGSFLPNGITSAFNNFVRSLDENDPEVTVVLDPGAVYGDPKRTEMFESVNDEFKTIARVGMHQGNVDEKYITGRYGKFGFAGHPRVKQIFFQSFAREYRRVFGEAHFDSVVCFEGFSAFWAALLASSGQSETPSLIMLHSDMLQEQRTRFVHLRNLFAMYDAYSHLVSVSESAFEANRNNLAHIFQVPESKFTFANNLVDSDRVLEGMKSPIDSRTASWMKDSDTCFVTVGRLSPEKGHRKLIDALKMAREKSKRNLKLVIVGGGPLQHQLSEHIRISGLKDAILLTGHSSNPYGLLARADCFTFSSDYEGQGLAVLEALMLDKPVISVDVIGPRSVLANGLGKLVENNVEEIAQALADFSKNPFPPAVFDAERYNKAAKDKMLDLLLG